MEEKSLNAQQRIEKIAEHYDISVRKLSQKCGLSTTFYRSCQNFTIRTVNKITQAFPEVSRDFLLTGRGEMIIGQRPAAETIKEMPSIVSNVMELINTADTYITIRNTINLTKLLKTIKIKTKRKTLRKTFVKRRVKKNKIYQFLKQRVRILLNAFSDFLFEVFNGELFLFIVRNYANFAEFFSQFRAEMRFIYE